MLPRTREPEVMDTPEEALAYDSMDHSEVNRKFVEDLLLLRSHQLKSWLTADREEPLECLDLGTGTAQIPVVLCEQWEDCRVVAADLASAMLELARYNIEAAGLIERIMLDHADAKATGYEDGRFALVFSNSIVHHIPEPEEVLREAVRVTAPGGALFFRDLMRPGEADEVERLVRQHAGQEAAEAQQMFRESLHAALTLDEIRELVVALGFSEATVQASSDRHWTWTASRPGGDTESETPPSRR